MSNPTSPPPPAYVALPDEQHAVAPIAGAPQPSYGPPVVQQQQQQQQQMQHPNYQQVPQYNGYQSDPYNGQAGAGAFPQQGYPQQPPFGYQQPQQQQQGYVAQSGYPMGYAPVPQQQGGYLSPGLSPMPPQGPAPVVPAPVGYLSPGLIRPGQPMTLVADSYLQVPERRGPIYESQYTYHPFCLLMNALIIGLGVGFILNLPLSRREPFGSFGMTINKTNFTAVGLLIGTGICYLIYFVSAFFSSTWKYLNNPVAEPGFRDYLSRMARVDNEQTPALRVRIECYHFETRHHTSHHRDANGNSHTRHHTTTERVVTFQSIETFPVPHPNCWSDESDMCPATSGLTRMKCSKLLSFGSPAAQMAFMSFKQTVVAIHQFRDLHIDAVDFLDVPNFHPNFLAVAPGYSIPAAMSAPCFVLATLLLLSWPYRMWVDSCSKKMSFVVRKKITF